MLVTFIISQDEVQILKERSHFMPFDSIKPIPMREKLVLFSAINLNGKYTVFLDAHLFISELFKKKKRDSGNKKNYDFKLQNFQPVSPENKSHASNSQKLKFCL